MFLYHVCKLDVFGTLTSIAFCRLLFFFFRSKKEGKDQESEVIFLEEFFPDRIKARPDLGPCRLERLSADDTS